jgi:hypothetical protein
MSIIAVSEKPFSGGRQFAKALAKKLGLPYVDVAVLVERAAAWSGDHKKPEAALKSAPDFSDRFIPHRHNQILQLQAALAQEVRGGMPYVTASRPTCSMCLPAKSNGFASKVPTIFGAWKCKSSSVCAAPRPRDTFASATGTSAAGTCTGSPPKWIRWARVTSPSISGRRVSTKLARPFWTSSIIGTASAWTL